MAKENYFSSQVCEQIAHELVKEQAEVLKHEAIVESIKKTILDWRQVLATNTLCWKTPS